MNNYFISEAFTNAIKNYITYKDNKDGIIYNSFLVLVIRKLVLIYGENDILVPYNENNVELLMNNLKKYRFSSMKLNSFFTNIISYYNNDINNIVPNKEFVKVEKLLIDMYMAKKLTTDILPEERKDFIGMLYHEYANNTLIISYNYFHSFDINEIINYFNKEDAINTKIEVSESKVLLAPEAYRIINKNYTDICLLNAEDVKRINDEVYSTLNVDKNAINFDYLYDVALFDFYNKNDKITSGNGYVDILLIMGIICTSILIVIVLYILFI